MNLSELQIGETAKILNICCSGLLRRKLLDMGLTPNATVMLYKKAPFGDPLYIKIRNYSLSLRVSEAQSILIERTKRWNVP